MKYDARACKFNMDTGCVELLLRDGRKISIDPTGVCRVDSEWGPGEISETNFVK